LAKVVIVWVSERPFRVCWLYASSPSPATFLVMNIPFGSLEAELAFT